MNEEVSDDDIEKNVNEVEGNIFDNENINYQVLENFGSCFLLFLILH